MEFVRTISLYSYFKLLKLQQPELSCVASFSGATQFLANIKSETNVTDVEPISGNIETTIENKQLGSSVLAGLMEPAATNKAYICQLCGASYTRKTALTRHLKKHDERYQFRCKTCCVYFITEKEVLDHQERTGCQRGHQCMYCGKAFRDNYTLKRHQTLVHNAEVSVPRLVCPYENCKKVFIHKEVYMGHINKHEGKMPYSCCKCLVMFHDKYKKNKHEAICVEEVSCKCDTCGKVFTDKSAMNRHKDSHHVGKTYTCSTCGNVYRYYSSLYKHRKSEHPTLTYS